MNGANTDGTNSSARIRPKLCTTDAPLDEKGDPRAKFFAFKKAIQEVNTSKLPALPKQAIPQRLPSRQNENVGLRNRSGGILPDARQFQNAAELRGPLINPPICSLSHWSG